VTQHTRDGHVTRHGLATPRKMHLHMAQRLELRAHVLGRDDQDKAERSHTGYLPQLRSQTAWTWPDRHCHDLPSNRHTTHRPCARLKTRSCGKGLLPKGQLGPCDAGMKTNMRPLETEQATHNH
jgi:hypothetical protein